MHETVGVLNNHVRCANHHPDLPANLLGVAMRRWLDLRKDVWPQLARLIYYLFFPVLLFKVKGNRSRIVCKRDSFVSRRLASLLKAQLFRIKNKEVVMEKSKTFLRLRHNILVCMATLGLCAGIVTSAVAKDEPVKQSGSFLVKFKANVSDAKIQEVADYYGANKVTSLSDSESSSHKDPEQWRKLKFESVNDLKDISRRIFQDNRVDEVE